MLRAVPIRRVAHRDSLFMGGDRELVLSSGVLAGALIFTAQQWRAAFFGVLLWSGALYIFRTMAKADPKLRHVYMRHRKYSAYYPPHSTPWREDAAAQGRQFL